FGFEAGLGVPGEDGAIDHDPRVAAHRNAEVGVLNVHVVERGIHPHRAAGREHDDTRRAHVPGVGVGDGQFAAAGTPIVDAAHAAGKVAVDHAVLDENLAIG